MRPLTRLTCLLPFLATLVLPLPALAQQGRPAIKECDPKVMKTPKDREKCEQKKREISDQLKAAMGSAKKGAKKH